MATTPTTTVSTQVGAVSTFLKLHERLLIVVLMVALAFAGMGKIENIVAEHDNVALAQAKVVTQAQIDKNAALAVQALQQAQQYQALVQQVQQQNTQLEQTNAALVAQLKNRQQVDATLSDPDLINRWKQLVPEVDATVVSDHIEVSDAGAHATVAQLETVPVLQTELTNAQIEKENSDKLVTQCNGNVTTLNQEVTGLNAQLADQKKQDQAELTAVKAQARKSKRNWFIRGVVTGAGIVAAIVIHGGI